MIKAEVVRKVTIPTDFRLGKQFYGKVVKYLFRDVNERIAKQQRVDGSRIKRNAPSTIDEKRRYGLKPLSLVGFGRTRARGKQRADHHFIGKSAYGQHCDGTSAVLSMSAEAKRIAGYLDDRGYVEWFGISEPAQKRIFRLAKTSMRAAIRSAVKRGGK